MGKRALLKTEFPHHAGGEADQTAADEEQHSCCLLKTTALNTLHDLI
jgi:hypothetical protein